MKAWSSVHTLPATESNRLERASQFAASLGNQTQSVIRWGLIRASEEVATVEIGLLEMPAPQVAHADNAAAVAGCHVALIVPTGVGAHFGGYVGDAGPAVIALEGVVDTVIANPNVVNGADLYGGRSKCLYTDGYTLDRFFAGETGLGRVRQSRIGLLLDQLDAATERSLLNAANGMVAVRGTNIVALARAKSALTANVHSSPYQHFLGEVGNLEALMEPAQELLAAGATTLALCTRVGGISDQDWISHYGGKSDVNPIGAIEALISRSMTQLLGVPVVHAPANLPELTNEIGLADPRAASEVSSKTGLPCLLEGLGGAAVPSSTTNAISVRDLTAIIMPAECCGGPPALAAREHRIPLIAVRQNRCQVGIAATALGLPDGCVFEAESYAEAIGIVAALKANVRPSTLARPLVGHLA